ncbi:MAG TPA: hypothetical protein VLM40_06570, partial [Gemmata sp.]|nr:hypothetical protein [Gemmata sp.]
GNVQQMIANNLTGAPDIRDRPAEFAAREATPKSQLLGRLVMVVEQSCNAIRGASDERLCQVTLVNKNNLSGLEAAVRSIAHFRGHTQEIIHMTRTILGEKYQYAGPK